MSMSNIIQNLNQYIQNFKPNSQIADLLEAKMVEYMTKFGSYEVHSFHEWLSNSMNINFLDLTLYLDLNTAWGQKIITSAMKQMS